MLDILRSLLGILVLVLICYALSAHRKKIDWKLVGTGLLLQLVFAILVLKIPIVKKNYSKRLPVFLSYFWTSQKRDPVFYSERK